MSSLTFIILYATKSMGLSTVDCKTRRSFYLGSYPPHDECPLMDSEGGAVIVSSYVSTVYSCFWCIDISKLIVLPIVLVELSGYEKLRRHEYHKLERRGENGGNGKVYRGWELK